MPTEEKLPRASLIYFICNLNSLTKISLLYTLDLSKEGIILNKSFRNYSDIIDSVLIAWREVVSDIKTNCG